MAEHELWSFNTALFVVILIITITFLLIFGVGRIFDVRNIKKNWATERCKPMIMPFAGLFGYDEKENFEFCLGKVFNTHSMPMFGSMGTMMGHFTGLLQNVFDSIGSLRNTIASLGGGINVIFQEFTERISTFFFRLRVSAIHIKTLIGRMYAIMFSVMYMGLSGITGMTSFTNTFLFSFLNTFCFPGDTLIEVEGKGHIPIRDIKLGDILKQTNSIVTGTFRFYSRGQPMVKLGSTIVSTNHYVMYLGHPIMAEEHPDAIAIGSWESDEPLYCLGTSNNRIPVGKHVFLDYDETDDGDKDTMNYIERRINGNISDDGLYKFTEYCSAIGENTLIRTQNGTVLAKDIKIGDKLSTGSKVVGLIRKHVSEICTLSDGTIITPSTLIWDKEMNKWNRVGRTIDYKTEEKELVSFIVVPNSQIELENGIRIRDYMELCSPDSEMHYSKALKHYKYE